MPKAKPPKARKEPQPATLDELEKKFFRDKLPALRGPKGIDLNPRGFIGDLLWRGLARDFFQWFLARYRATPRDGKSKDSPRGISAQSLLDGFIDWATGSWSGLMADRVRDLLKKMAPLLVKFLAGYDIEPINGAAAPPPGWPPMAPTPPPIVTE